MQIKPIRTVSFTIHDIESQGLDPITVILQDIAPKQGRLIIECWGEAWSVFWGGMSDGCTVRQFAINCDAGYITQKLSRPKAKKRDVDYLFKIVKAVKVALETEGTPC